MADDQPASPGAPFIPPDADTPPVPPATWRVFGTEVVLPPVARAGHLEHGRLDRPDRDPRDRGAGVEQLRRGGQPRDAHPGAPGLPARHRRRRDHRPLRPAQGHGALRRRPGRAPRDAPVRRREHPRPGAHLARARAHDAPLGPGAGRDRAALRARGAAGVGELAVARRVVRDVPDRLHPLLAARRHRDGARVDSTSSRRSRSIRKRSR